MTDTELVEKELSRVRKLHQECDEKISIHMRQTMPDHLTIQRIKKHKLLLKEQMDTLCAQLIPDIIA